MIAHKETDELPESLLSALTSLCGPSDYMVQLLQNGEQFPRLINVDIRPFDRARDLLERRSKHTEALALLAKLVPEIQLTTTAFRKVPTSAPKRQWVSYRGT
jgi:hypothetical protein